MTPKGGALMTVRDALSRSTGLAEVTETPLLDAQLILAHILGVSRSWLYAHDQRDLTAAQQEAYTTALERRRCGEPVAYITQTKSFWDIDLHVSMGVLVPRPETEVLVQALLDHFDDESEDDPMQPRLIADLGTGSGAIAIVLASTHPSWTVIATDLSAVALRIAQCNRKSLCDQVHLIQADWLDAFASGQFDAIISNPPYIPTNDIHLRRLSSEPLSALASGEDGLDDIRRIISGAPRCLKPGGRLMLEHGYDQQHQVIDLMTSSGWQDIVGIVDLAGQPRVVSARWP